MKKRFIKRKHNYRFSLFVKLNSTKDHEIIIMIDFAIICDLIFKKDEKWQAGMMMTDGNNLVFLAEFKDWRYQKELIIETPTGHMAIDQEEVKKMKQAIFKYDKRIKF
jgi:hypothetical protein